MTHQVKAAVRILETADPMEKAALTETTARLWFEGRFAFTHCPHGTDPKPPDKPARDSRVRRKYA